MSSKESKNTTKASNSTTSRSEENQDESKYSIADYEESIKNIITNKIAPPDDMVNELRNYIAQQLRNTVDNQKYDDANKYESANNILIQLTDPCSGYYQDKVKREAELNQYLAAKQRLNEVTEEWNKTIADAKGISKQRIEDLKKVHNEEIENFQKDWENPDYLSPFNKPSQEILNLRDIEKIYAMNKEFERAKTVHKQIRQLEEKEAKQQKEKAMATMKKQFDQLLSRQNNELNILMMKEKQIIDDLKVQMEKDQLPYRIRIERYEKQQDSKKKVKRIEEYIQEKPSKPLRSRETIHTEKPTKMLPVGALDVRKFVKTKMKSQRNK